MADGKIFAAEFALRRNVKALDKILIEDSDDGVVKYAFPPQIAALSGYAYANSVADLPEDPVNKTLGYVVGDKFYIYVGEGGNAKDGLYQEVQGFVGPQGIPGPKGDKGDAGDGAIDEAYLANYLQQNQYQTASDVNSALAIYATQAYVTQEIDKLLGGASGAYDTLKEIEEVLKGNVDSIGDLFEVLDTKWTQDNTLIAHWNEAYSWGNHATAGYVAKTYVDSNFVAIGTKQEITGEKDFTGGFKVNGGVLEYNASLGTWVLNGDLLVTGGISAFSNIEGFTPSTITDAVLIDNMTIKRNSVGALYVASGSDDGGIDEAYLAEYLTANNYAKKSDINSALTDYATQSWVTGRGYFLASNFTKANIKSTLGISDWALASAKPTYTASEVGALAQDSSSTNADLDTILESKTAVLKPFFQSFTSNNIGSARKGVLRMAYNGSESQLLFDHYNRLLRYRTIGSNPKDWATLAFTSDIPTKLSQLTDDVVSGKYLSLAGGTISQSAYWSTKFKSTGQTSSAIAFEVANGNVGYLMYADGSKWQVTAQNWSATHTLLHSGNYSNYALPITGGTVNGDISLPNGNRLISPSGNIAGTRIFGDDTTNYRTILGTATLNTLLIGNSTLKFWKGAVSKEYEIIDTSMASISFPKYIATGIGTTEQSGYKVKGNSVDATFGANDATGGAYIWVASYHALRFGTNGAERVRITPEGNLAIGGTTASEKLHVYGNILATGGVTAQNSSDRRLKKNIRKFNASKVLMSLGAVWEYEYIDSEVQKNHIYEGTHFGLIYQRVKGTKLDVMCHEREDGMGALNYIHPKFISLIAGATMENISEVEKLKRKIRYLENKVKQLESRA